MRRINCIEERLLLVARGTIDLVAELDDPARLATPSTNLKFHGFHQRVPKKSGLRPVFSAHRSIFPLEAGNSVLIERGFPGGQSLMRQAVTLAGFAECDCSDAYRGDDRDLTPRCPSGRSGSRQR